MLSTYTARYTRIDSGYLGQLVEWPEVVTEGESLEDCRFMLQDALEQMIRAYQEKVVPVKRHRVLDRITANELCKQAGLDGKF